MIAHKLRVEVSTTQDEYDEIVLHHHWYHEKQLVCKKCRCGDGRFDRTVYFCSRCNASKDRGHFTKAAIDNWRGRGKKEGTLKCKENSDKKIVENHPRNNEATRGRNVDNKHLHSPK